MDDVAAAREAIRSREACKRLRQEYDVAVVRYGANTFVCREIHRELLEARDRYDEVRGYDPENQRRA